MSAVWVLRALERRDWCQVHRIGVVTGELVLYSRLTQIGSQLLLSVIARTRTATRRVLINHKVIIILLDGPFVCSIGLATCSSNLRATKAHIAKIILINLALGVHDVLISLMVLAVTVLVYLD